MLFKFQRMGASQRLLILKIRKSRNIAMGSDYLLA